MGDCLGHVPFDPLYAQSGLAGDILVTHTVEPVRPEDVLHLPMEVTEVLPSKTKPDRGTVKSFYRLTNQKGELVMTVKGSGMFGRRPGVVA